MRTHPYAVHAGAIGAALWGAYRHELLEGVRFLADERIHTQSLVMRSYSGTVRYIDAEHSLAKLRRRRDEAKAGILPG